MKYFVLTLHCCILVSSVTHAQASEAVILPSSSLPSQPDPAIKTIFDQINFLFKSGEDRTSAFELAMKAYRMSLSPEISIVGKYYARYLLAYAQQEYLDEHTKPYNALRKLLAEINSGSTDIPELRHNIYHRLTSSSLVLNKLDTAIYFAHQANKLGSALYGDASCKRVFDYFMLSYSLIEAARDEEALEAAQKALQLAKLYCSDQSPDFIDAHRLMGFYHIKSNYQATRALPFYELALHKSLEIGDAERAFKSLYYICRTGILSEDPTPLNDYLFYFDSIHNIADEVIRTKNQIARLDIEYSMARKEHNLSKAIDKKNKFLRVLEDKLPERGTAILDGYYSIIEMTIELDQPTKTHYYLNQLESFLKNYPLNQDQLLSYLHIRANGLVHIGQWQQALIQAEKGLHIISPSLSHNRLSNSEFDQIADLYFYRQFLKIIANYHNNLYTETKKFEDLKNYQLLLNQMIAGTIKMIERDDERMSIQATNEIASDFEKLISVNIALYNASHNFDYVEDAFQLTDIASNLTFFRGRNQQKAITRTAITDSLIQVKRNLLTRLSEIRMKTESNALERHKNQEEELNLRVTLSHINLFLEEHEPLYMANMRAVQTSEIADFQHHVLDSQTAFIHYFYFDRLHAFVVLQDQLQYIPLNISNSFVNKIESFNQLLSSPTDNRLDFARKSRNLGSVLLDSIISFLPTEINRLIIAPYGQLNRVSFESLLTDDPVEFSEFGKFQFLIKDYAVSYAFSMTALLDEKMHVGKPKKQSLLAIAPSYVSKVKPGSQLTAQRLAVEESQLLPLAGAKKETIEIGKLVKRKKLLIGDLATEAETRKHMPNHSIWHFAMHALLNENDPMLKASPKTGRFKTKVLN